MPYSQNIFNNIPQTLTPREVQNPQLVIKDFFSSYNLPNARRELEKWVRSAFAEKSRLSKKESLSLLYLQEHLIRLLEAGQLLDDEPSSDGKGIDLTDAPDSTLLDTTLFYTARGGVQAWDCFPRHLSRSEYGNPYRVFSKCLGHLSLSGWRKFLKELFYAATYDTQVNEAITDDDLHYTSKCLFKLLEACHLINVREIDPGLPAYAGSATGPAPTAFSKEDLRNVDTNLKEAI